MTDTPKHIADMQLKLWLQRTPGDRLYQSIIDIETMRNALRDYKIRNGLSLGDLDPVGDFLKKKQVQNEKKED